MIGKLFWNYKQVELLLVPAIVIKQTSMHHNIVVGSLKFWQRFMTWGNLLNQIISPTLFVNKIVYLPVLLICWFIYLFISGSIFVYQSNRVVVWLWDYQSIYLYAIICFLIIISQEPLCYFKQDIHFHCCKAYLEPQCSITLV